MSEDEKEARTFNQDQQQMFGESEANQAGQPVRPRESDLPGPLDVSFEPPPARAETTEEEEPRLHVVPVRAEGGTDITGGTDKFGPGGLADDDQHADGTGTAPNTVGGLGAEEKSSDE